MLRRYLTVLLCVLVALSCSSCSLGVDVDTLLRAPKTNGEQQEIQAALEKYINSTGANNTINAPGGYVLKYPKSGNYRSSFILKDMDNDGVEDAIAFYGTGNENSNVHLNFLQKKEGKWQSICDVEGASPDIERVSFSDLLGNGVMELLTGWNIDNVPEKQLVLYTIQDGQFNQRFKELYSSLVLADMTACGHDNLLLLHTDATENVSTAQLWTATMDKTVGQMVLTELGSTRLDGYIQSFSNSKVGKLSDSLVGVYVDGIKSSGGMVTELIYWDEGLYSPFYNAKKNVTELTYRNSTVACRDIDGDGSVEWPVTATPIGMDSSPNAESAQVLTAKWYAWDFVHSTPTEKFSSLMNLADGYYLRLDAAWEGLYSVSYDTALHTLRLHSLNKQTAGQDVLAVRTQNLLWATTTGSADDSDTSLVEEGKSHEYTTLEIVNNVRYEVWFSSEAPFNLDMESVRYMFTRLTK